MNRLTTNRGFWLTLLLSIITLGFYQWYLIHAFAKETIFLLGWLTFGIMFIVVMCKQLYLQNAVNETYNKLNV
jgi:CDP-diglyceride synthetase